MSKRQALLETLLGAAVLKGNQMVAETIRRDIFKMTRDAEASGYQRLAHAAAELSRPQTKAA